MSVDILGSERLNQFNSCAGIERTAFFWLSESISCYVIIRLARLTEHITTGNIPGDALRSRNSNLCVIGFCFQSDRKFFSLWSHKINHF